MSVRIGSASIDERGKAAGGKAGDQTGREVYALPWYSGRWNVMIRAKSIVTAEKMAKYAEAVCANNNVGYDQYQRNTLRSASRTVGWDASKITTPCSTDCSAFMTCCAEAAGINMEPCYSSGNAPTTWTMATYFKSTGAFDVFKDSKYLATPDYLRRGDILVRESGHTVIVLDDGPMAESPKYEDFTGKFTVSTNTDPLNCRTEPNTKATIVGKFEKGTTVTASKKCGEWYYVTDGTVTGWASGIYLTMYIDPIDEEIAFNDGDFNTETCYHMVMAAMQYAARLKESPWAKDVLDDAVEAGITDGTRPQVFATREEVAAMIWRATHE